jgi:hypothetical protein
MMNRPIMGLEKALQPQKPIKIEPWMVEFVNGRHTHEEWDGFATYCAAGSFRRWLIRAGWLFYAVLADSR